MIRTIPLLFLTLALFAADPPPVPAAADQAYRAYLAAVSKVYTTETAKVKKTLLTQEATLRRKDPAAADQVKGLIDKIEAGGALTDIAAGDLLGDAGSAEALMGTWDYTPTGYTTMGNYVYTFKPGGIALQTWTTTSQTVTRTFKWAVHEGSFVVDMTEPGITYGPGSVHSMIGSIKLPVPKGPIMFPIREKTTSPQGNSDLSMLGTLARHTEAAAAK
jgi:hypothetical protein